MAAGESWQKTIETISDQYTASAWKDRRAAYRTMVDNHQVDRLSELAVRASCPLRNSSGIHRRSMTATESQGQLSQAGVAASVSVFDAVDMIVGALR